MKILVIRQIDRKIINSMLGLSHGLNSSCKIKRLSSFTTETFYCDELITVLIRITVEWRICYQFSKRFNLEKRKRNDFN